MFGFKNLAKNVFRCPVVLQPMLGVMASIILPICIDLAAMPILNLRCSQNILEKSAHRSMHIPVTEAAKSLRIDAVFCRGGPIVKPAIHMIGVPRRLATFSGHGIEPAPPKELISQRRMPRRGEYTVLADRSNELIHIGA